jgi:hypothetical protein
MTPQTRDFCSLQRLFGKFSSTYGVKEECRAGPKKGSRERAALRRGERSCCGKGWEGGRQQRESWQREAAMQGKAFGCGRGVTIIGGRGSKGRLAVGAGGRLGVGGRGCRGRCTPDPESSSTADALKEEIVKGLFSMAAAVFAAVAQEVHKVRAANLHRG